MAGLALVGLGSTLTLGAFYAFYFLNALGNVCGGPLPNQVLLSRWFEGARGKAMGTAYLGIGVGGALVPLLAHALTQALGWRAALQVARRPDDRRSRCPPPSSSRRPRPASPPRAAAGSPAASSIRDVLRRPAFYLLAIGSMASIGAVGGTMQNLKLYLAMDRGLAQGARRRGALARPRRQPRRPRRHGLAGRPVGEEARHAAHLPDRRALRAPVRPRAGAGRACAWPRSCSASASAATT